MNKEHVNRLMLGKTIYAGRKRKSKEVIQSIIKLECEEHIQLNPDLITKKIDEPIKNNDGSITILIHFIPASYVK